MTDLFTVELPGGGQINLQGAEEVDMWNAQAKHYVDDFGLTKANDLGALGAILIQRVAQLRAMQDLADNTKAREAQNIIQAASDEIRKQEVALGIDKKTREAGGQHTIADYITQLKKAGHSKGVHIVERVKKYEAICMEARWKLRVLRNGDDEDRAYHSLTPETFLTWLEAELTAVEELDKTFAHEKGVLFVGKL